MSAAAIRTTRGNRSRACSRESSKTAASLADLHFREHSCLARSYRGRIAAHRESEKDLVELDMRLACIVYSPYERRPERLARRTHRQEQAS